MGVVTGGILLVGVGLLGRAVELQVVHADRWSERARAQSAAQMEVPAARGGIYDRSGKPLALDGQEYRAYLAPRELIDRRSAAATATRIFGLSAREEARLREAASGWVAIPRRVSRRELDQLLGAVPQGVHFERVSSRVLPQGGLARALLGSVDATGRGRSGLELVMDSVLRAESGAILTRRDARGEQYPVPGPALSPARPGLDVYLTIDAELQAIAEGALETALETTGASGGDVLIGDPLTGELLAVASRRSGQRRSVPAFTDPFEPGSTAKPFLLAALLSEGRATLEDRVYAEHGTYRIGRRTIRDVHPYDTLAVSEVIRYSSNIGAAKLSARLDPGLQYRYLRDFGFGTPTGVECPLESSGLLRRPQKWSGLSQVSLAMGYEMMVTSVQLLAAYGAFANGGVLMRPGIVREIRDAAGHVVWRRRPQPIRRVIDRKVARQITAVLSSVVSDGGTGKLAALETLPVAGKTGTTRIVANGRYTRDRYVASFVGYMPADHPSLVVLAKLEDPQGPYYGGLTAAPLTRTVVEAALATRGIRIRGETHARVEGAHRVWNDASRPPGEGSPYILAVNSRPRAWQQTESGSAGMRVLPDLSGMSVRAAVARLHEMGLYVELQARGRVESQLPGAGVSVRSGATVLLR